MKHDATSLTSAGECSEREGRAALSSARRRSLPAAGSGFERVTRHAGDSVALSWRIHMRLHAVLAFVFFAFGAFAEQRFPPPEFESGYTLPQTTTPAARSLWLQY